MQNTGNAAVSPTTSVPYAATIERLETRAKAARRRVKIVGLIMFSGIYLVAIGMFFWITRDSAGTQITWLAAHSTRDQIEVPFVRHVVAIKEQLAPFQIKKYGETPALPKVQAEEVARMNRELKIALDDLERAVKIADTNRTPATAESKIVPVISTVVFSLGAVTLLVLLIQIAVMFMRYYTRIAELYDAQADALRASGGDPKLAYGFLDHFSPNNIEIGKTPSTLYEKALDTVREALKQRSGS
jgi:hypothetical protein